MFDLVSHGPDTYVGTGPRYSWGGLYGGQIVAQALRAATLSVDPAFAPHSIRAYFIRRGDHEEPVRYEVDRIRNGRSFVTRRVVARQAVGAILNAECSFQRPEQSPVVQTVYAPDLPSPDTIANSSFTEHFDRRVVPADALASSGRDGAGRSAAWVRVVHDLGEVDDPGRAHEFWLAYASDDVPADAVLRVAKATRSGETDLDWMFVSLDHSVWFHRPMRADRWHLYDMTCHHLGGSRGLAFGHVFTAEGEHVASFAQEVLVRVSDGEVREKPVAGPRGSQ